MHFPEMVSNHFMLFKFRAYTKNITLRQVSQSHQENQDGDYTFLNEWKTTCIENFGVLRDQMP